MKKLGLLLVTALLLTSGPSAFGQNNFGLEFRAGASFATQELGDADLKTGLALEGILSYHFVTGFGVYAGWGWNQFSADHSFAGDNMNFEETGYFFGLDVNARFHDGPIGVYVRGGGIYNHIEIENADGDIVSNSGHGFGWQTGIGLNINLGNHLQFKPGIKYQSLSREITMGGEATQVDLTYLNAGMGIAFQF